MKKLYTVVHLFSGSGGCSLGFADDGFDTIAAVDCDPVACADLDYLLNRKASRCADISKMEPADLRRLTGNRRPDVLVLTAPCKAWSRLQSKARRMSAKYVAMTSLAVRGVWLGLYAWDERPPLIIIENVKGMATEGRALMEVIKSELRKFGYLFDIRTHNVGKLGNLAQSRERCLFVARDPERCPAFLMVPEEHPLRPCGDELGKLPPPVLDAKSESMHRLPQLSGLNWLRIASIPPGKDWKALPARIRLGGEADAKRQSKYGVERWDMPAHTVAGVASRVPSGRCAVADPRYHGLGPNAHSGIMGVENPGAPAHTVTGNARPQGTWGSYADPLGGPAPTTATPRARRARPAPAGQAALFAESAATTATPAAPVADAIDLAPVSDHGGNRQNGGFGVNAWDSPAHTVVAEGTVQNTWACAATPIIVPSPPAPRWKGKAGDRGGAVDARLGCKQWAGSYGVLAPGAPAPTVLANTRHDNAAGSYADPRLGYRHEDDEAEGKHSGRGCYGVVDLAAPAPTIRGHMEVRQAPGAIASPVLDVRKAWDTSDPESWAGRGRPQAYGVQDWTRPASTVRAKQQLVNSRAAVAHPDYPAPTHWLRRDAAGEWVLHGPPIELDKICYLVIMTEDEPGVWSWHRPMTDLELAVLQSLPAEHNGAMLAMQGPSGLRREHIGNMLPRRAAYQIARACRATLDQPQADFRLVGRGKIWVTPGRRRAPVHANIEGATV